MGLKSQENFLSQQESRAEQAKFKLKWNLFLWNTESLPTYDFYIFKQNQVQPNCESLSQRVIVQPYLKAYKIQVDFLTGAFAS